MMKIYAHWSDFPMENWRWPDFSPRELACRGTGKLAIDERAMDKLQKLRNLLGRPVILNSAFRSDEHNRAVGGAKGSYHLKARAFDVRMDNQNPHEFEAAALAVGFTGFGFYRRLGFIHIDTGPAREWERHGGRWPSGGATGLPSEPVRKPSKDKAVQGAALLGAAPVIREISGALSDMGGFLETLHPVAQIGSIVLAAVGGLLVWQKIKDTL